MVIHDVVAGGLASWPAAIAMWSCKKKLPPRRCCLLRSHVDVCWDRPAQKMYKDFICPIDETVLLCVDQVVVHHCKKDIVVKECAEEEEKGGRSDHDE